MSQRLSKKQLIEAAEEFGTPLYVYHAEKVEEQLNDLNKEQLRRSARLQC